MRIALIRPGMGGRYRSLACLEPQALSILAALSPPDVEVVAVDDRFEQVPYHEQWDLVALSLGTFQARRAYRIAERFRARGVKVVLGGFHPTLCPEEASEHADAVAVGEAEGLWPTIVEDARRGQLQPIYRHQSPPALEGIIPDIRPLSGKWYQPMSLVQFGRGCQYRCDFCSIRAFYNGPPRWRPVPDVLREIQRKGRRWVYFVDDNLVSNRERVKELLEAVIPLKLRWSSQVSLDFVDDPELLRLMVRSGCQSVIVGLESLHKGSLRQMGKGWMDPGEYVRKLAILRQSGILVYATFVFGYAHDRPEHVRQALDFALEQRFFLANFNHLQPYPGTRLYGRLREQGRLHYDRWWLDERYRFGDVVFDPADMSAEELRRATADARARFHSHRAIWQRLADRRANAGSLRNGLTFLVANYASRQDMRRKQGMRLGGEP